MQWPVFTSHLSIAYGCVPNRWKWLGSHGKSENSWKKCSKNSIFQVVASYSREEAINLRAGPEIVIGEEEISEILENPPEIAERTPKTPEVSKIQNPVKRRRTEEAVEPEKYVFYSEIWRSSLCSSKFFLFFRSKSPDPMVPFTFDSPAPENIEKPIKESPVFENKRRSRRIAQKPPEVEKKVVKKETATILDVQEAIKVSFSSVKKLKWQYSNEKLTFWMIFKKMSSNSMQSLQAQRVPQMHQTLRQFLIFRQNLNFSEVRNPHRILQS